MWDEWLLRAYSRGQYFSNADSVGQIQTSITPMHEQLESHKGYHLEDLRLLYRTMSLKPPKSPSKRGAIAQYADAYGLAAAHNRYGIAKSSLHYMLESWRKRGTCRHKKGAGRPRTATNGYKKRAVATAIKHKIKASPAKIAATLEKAATLPDRSPISPSRSSVRRIMKELKINRYKERRLPVLGRISKAKRLAYAQQHQNFDWT